MKCKRVLTICVAAALTVTFAFGTGTAAAAPQSGAVYQETETAAGAAQVTAKDEIVYARLSAGGKVESVYAVNHFEVARGGAVTDYGGYGSVKNLTDTGEIAQNGDAVSFRAGEGNFYYQGNMETTQLPWNVGISYYLDGQELAPGDLAGKTGALEIRIGTAKNASVDPTFYDNYMLQITVTLDAQTCGITDAGGGAQAEAGKNKVVAFTAMPGKDGDFVLKADVTDFEMSTGVQISGVPYSMDIEMPDMEDRLGDLEQLPDAISDLNDGVGDLKNGTGSVKQGADKLVDGSAAIKGGLGILNNNSGALVSGSAQINSGLSAIAAALTDASSGDTVINQVMKLLNSLPQLAQGLRDMAGGLTQMKDGFAQGYGALDGAIQTVPDTVLTADQISALYAATGGDPDLTASLDVLVADQTAAQTIKGTYGQVKPAFDGVGTAVDGTVSALDTVAGSLDGAGDMSQFGQLLSGIVDTAKNYESFHNGLVSYTDGVKALDSNYGTFHSGLASFAEGVGTLDKGVGDLKNGTDTLNDEVAGLPEQLQQTIDDMKAEYLPSDFETVSFTSAKNTGTEFVQFVMQCEGVEMPAAEEEAPVEAKPETFWDRLVALFTGGQK